MNLLRGGISIPNQEDHGFYPWVNWSSGKGCSPLVGVSWEPWALPVGLHLRKYRSKTMRKEEECLNPSWAHWGLLKSLLLAVLIRYSNQENPMRMNLSTAFFFDLNKI
jgi:hypothetical protein